MIIKYLKLTGLPAYFCGVILASTLVTNVAWAKTVASISTQKSILFSQTAGSANIKSDPNRSGWHLLTLNNVNKHTVWFTDRPQRSAGTLPTAKYVAHWDKGANSFKINNPNASLIVFQDKQGLQTEEHAVLQLSKPQYNIKTNTLTYAIKHISNAKDGDTLTAGQFGEVALFIDDTSCSYSEGNWGC
jgi:hypothetical protein